MGREIHYALALPMFKASKSTSLYSFPIQISSFGVGVIAAIMLAIVTIKVTLFIIVIIVFILFFF